MKKDIHHKDFRPVVFKDSTNGFSFLTRSTAKSKTTVKWEDGNEYPEVEVYISSASHPFYTGKEKLVDIEGRVDRFKAKTAKAKELKAKTAAKAAKQARREASKSSDEPQKLGATSSSESDKSQSDSEQ